MTINSLPSSHLTMNRILHVGLLSIVMKGERGDVAYTNENLIQFNEIVM